MGGVVTHTNYVELDKHCGDGQTFWRWTNIINKHCGYGLRKDFQWMFYWNDLFYKTMDYNLLHTLISLNNNIT